MAKPTVYTPVRGIFDHDDLAVGLRLAKKRLHQFLHGAVDAAKHRNLH